MPKHATTQSTLFEFAVWASRRRAAPSPLEIKDFFGVSLHSARAIRKKWIEARNVVAIRVARNCADRINSREAPTTTHRGAP